MQKSFVLLLTSALSISPAFAQRQNPATKYLYGKNSAVKVLQHVRIIDGTGGPVIQNQTIVIEGGKITRIGQNIAAPANAEVLDLTGYTVLPGLVGMHDHIYYLQRPNSDADFLRSAHVPRKWGHHDSYRRIGRAVC